MSGLRWSLWIRLDGADEAIATLSRESRHFRARLYFPARTEKRYNIAVDTRER
ncbi:hypothetical protein NG799_08980 [Laspinema sp. D1]|uniref:Uncharacterized protein n=1 Tax=Laspinema palackyanum D2a TaxID=2953684 RepID=A0ABT2MNZ6_9CYAN|nr:hypothetical protein [Laspinema sp. D2b]MCT7966464.1 hypothetical protein [Laspinema sp. D2a]